MNGTYSKGINVSGSPMIYSFNAQLGISMDTKGNVAVQGSFSGGVSTGSGPSISATMYRSVTNALDIGKLTGMGYQVGGSMGVPVAGVPVAVGADFNIMPDVDTGETYYGVTRNVGFGVPGGELHVEWGKTITIEGTQFNVFDTIDNICIKIMEW